METIQTILSFIGNIAMIVLIVLMIRFVIIKSRKDSTKEYFQILNYIFSLIKLRDQYRAYGFEAEAKKLDERIKELLAKNEL
jgi:hypothetical protein